jgi:urea transporter
MNGLLARWEDSCGSSKLLRFVDRNLRGIGQVMFQDNPLSGLLFFVAIGWGSYAGGVPQVAIGGLVAVLVATLMAQWLRVDEAALNAGLYGFNAYLVGLALATFMTSTLQLWVYVVFGGAISVVVTLALGSVLKTWSVSALTAPFVLTAWLLLLGTNAFAGLDASALPPVGTIASIVPIDPDAANPLHVADFVAGIFTSITQVFLKGHAPAGLLLLAGLAVNSVAAAVFSVVGALVAVATAHALGAESDLITAGLIGFNPVLTAIALGAVFYRPGPRVVVYTLLASALTVIVQGAMMAALTPFGIPTLTAAFVLVTWLFLLPGQKLE